jgi:hypothetical protein
MKKKSILKIISNKINSNKKHGDQIWHEKNKKKMKLKIPSNLINYFI